MSELMNAVVLTGPDEYEIQKVPVPKPGEGEVLVKIRAVSICGSDPKLFKGAYRDIGWPPSYPFIPGHEFSGEVVALGGGVTEFKVGDHVAGEAHSGCGVCENCKKGLYNLCLNYGNSAAGHRHYGFTWQGAYAQYNAYNVRALSKMPESVTFVQGSMVDTAGTALQAVKLTGIEPGGFTVVIGPGPVGIFAMQIAKAMGSRVIMVGRRARLEIAKEMGADYAINYEQVEDVVEEVRRITGGIGADQAFECAGSDAALKQTVLCTKKNGSVAYVALPAVDDHMVPTKTLVMNQIHLYGSRANPNCSKEVLSMMEQGWINPDRMITHVLPLEEIHKAMDIFSNRKDGAMKVVVEPH